MNQVSIVDYGMGNIKSVCRALEHVGAKPNLCSDPEKLKCADRVILPGVGAFGDGMVELKKTGMDQALVAYADAGRPLLGICLGMQLLFDSSEEHGSHQGLGLIPGTVQNIPTKSEDGWLCKIPHIGWSPILTGTTCNRWNKSILENIPQHACFYFVHSYVAVPNESKYILAECLYGRTNLTAVARNENMIGTQFHPEKSGRLGLRLLHNFMKPNIKNSTI